MSAIVRELGRREYLDTWESMRRFTDGRGATTADECWLVEHPPVFTLGLNGRREHLHDPGGIPVVQCDRGGQVTYHGPGQPIVYALVDLQRLGCGVRDFVHLLEQAVIDTVAAADVAATRVAGAPGVYVDGRKLAALGLRVRRGCSYHGVALNVDLDLQPFTRINPCGYPGLEVTRLADLGAHGDAGDWGRRLAAAITGKLGARAQSVRAS